MFCVFWKQENHHHILPKAKEGGWQERQSDTDSSMKTFSAKGRTKCFGRFLPKRTFIASSIHVTTMSVVGILPTRICRKVLQAGFVWPSLQRDAHFWCKHVMIVNAQGLDDLLMVLNNLSLLLGHLRNGALMPLGLCQELRQARSTS